jgi:uncharacterized damage-inducible protein DinB
LIRETQSWRKNEKNTVSRCRNAGICIFRSCPGCDEERYNRQTCRSGVERKLTALAEDFPEEKYDFKPTPAQRSFAEQLLHAAGACYYFTNPAMGQKPPAAEDPKREQYKSKADIVAFVKKSFADGATAIQSKGERGLLTEVVYYPQQKARVIDIAYGIIEHSGEHYGQLVVYYRLAGLVPPESRPKK